MVKVNRKLVALLLMSIMLVSMVALSASAFEGKAATTGGNLNIWVEKTLKGAKIATVANGTNLGEVEDLGKGVGFAHKYGGYVRMRYVAKVEPAPAAKAPTKAWAGMGKAATTGGDLNVWEKPNFTGKKMQTVANGTIFPNVIAYKEGYALVTTKEGRQGFVRTKYLQQYKAAPVDPIDWTYVGDVEVVGTGKDSVIYIWKDMTKEGGSKKAAYRQVPVGTKFADAWKTSDGWTEVWFEVEEGEWDVGYIMTKYAQPYIDAPDPVLTSKNVAKVKVEGTAKDSIINLWKGYSKEGGSKKASYGPVAVGTVFENVTMWSDGWTDVEVELEDGSVVEAHIDSKYITVVKK